MKRPPPVQNAQIASQDAAPVAFKRSSLKRDKPGNDQVPHVVDGDVVQQIFVAHVSFALAAFGKKLDLDSLNFINVTDAGLGVAPVSLGSPEPFDHQLGHRQLSLLDILRIQPLVEGRVVLNDAAELVRRIPNESAVPHDDQSALEPCRLNALECTQKRNTSSESAALVDVVRSHVQPLRRDGDAADKTLGFPFLFIDKTVFHEGLDIGHGEDKRCEGNAFSFPRPGGIYDLNGKLN